MLRIIIICEGETEQEFCRTILAPHFLNFNIQIQSPRIKKSMGGIVKWQHLKKQIEIHLKNDQTAYVSLFIDYYGINKNHQFPDWLKAENTADKSERMNILEKGMSTNIRNEYGHRFIPYIQLHEFEGLLFNNIQVFREWISEDKLIGLKELEKTIEEYNNPEMINDNPNSSPSHRLQRIIKGYEKIIDGNILASEIGLDRIRQKSPRFNEWINLLEQITVSHNS